MTNSNPEEQGPYGQPVPGPPQQPQQGHGYPTQYHAPQPYIIQPSPPPKKKVLRNILGAIGGLALMCCGGSVLVKQFANDGDKKSASATASQAVESNAATASSQPAREQAPAPKDAELVPKDPVANRFDMKLGSTLTVTEDGGVSEITIRSVKSYKGKCSGGLSDADNGLYVVADVQVSVKSGTADINSLFFEWVGEDGTTANPLSGAFSGCEKNDLGSGNNVRAGQKRTGQIVFDVASAKGSIEYQPGLGSGATGSWKAG